MKIIFGLGNPGLRYAATRHNCGFLTVEKLAASLGAEFDKRSLDNLVAVATYRGERLMLAKPQLYMNRSGFPLVRLLHYHKVEYSDILAIHDDMALPPGSLRFRRGGSDGGHNGVKSIVEQTGTTEFNRLKIGIGPAIFDAADYVTSCFTQDEALFFAPIFSIAAEAALLWLEQGIGEAMNQFNGREVAADGEK
jgi:peptidyl-tRNA hydrolase, PTH1 family